MSGRRYIINLAGSCKAVCPVSVGARVWSGGFYIKAELAKGMSPT